jgi:hypothetical protein
MSMWLKSLGLAKFIPIFAENGITGKVLELGLDEVSLVGLGITLPIHHKLLRAAIAKALEIPSS